MFADLLRGSIALALISGPGWWIARAWRLPCPALAGFLGGTLGFVTLVLALQLAGLPLNRGTLGTGWLAVAGLAVGLLARRATGFSFNAPAPTIIAATEPAPPWHRPLLFVAIVPVLAVIAYRTIWHPLYGLDTGFRWGLLAELMWKRHTLDFYPAVTDADFMAYVWPDGIPPLVSSLYVAAYAVAGRVAPIATAPLVLAQHVLLLAGTGALARRYFSATAATLAMALLGVTALSAWAVTMGHETGFTALALVGLLLYLPDSRADDNAATVVAAGLAAAVGALAREYGWAFVVFGLLTAAQRKLPGRSLVIIGAVVLATAAPWYLRNAVRTGNPLPNHPVAGLFPVNEAHERLMALYRESYDLMPQLQEDPLLLVRNGGAVLIAGVLGAVLLFRQARALVGAAGLVVALWVISVPHTAAGLANSLRVLSPALAVGAVLGGAILARWTGRRVRPMVFLTAVALSIDGAIRALTLPNNTYALPPAKWLEADRVLEAFQDQPSYHEIAARTRGARVLGHGPNVYLAKLGVQILPPWSPELAFLFETHLSPAAARARLRASGVRYLLVAKGQLNQLYLAQSPALAEATPEEMPLVLERGNLLLFEFAPGKP